MYVCTSMFLLCIFVSFLASAIHKTGQLYEEYFDDTDLSQLWLISFLYDVLITITITAVFPFFLLSFFRSFFLPLKKKAHARQKQNKVNIFSTTKKLILEIIKNIV